MTIVITRVIIINSAIFPFYQGGPLEHIIAGKAICFKEALEDDFREYAQNVIDNTKACRDKLCELGSIVSGTDNHLFLINTLDTFGVTGKQAQNLLESINITTNKNMIPNDTLSPKETSGLRIGFAAVTTRGCNKKDAEKIGELIYKFLKQEITKEKALEEVKELVSNWTLIENL